MPLVKGKENNGKFKKGSIPHNKGVISEKKLKRIELFKQNKPINCKKHGEHLDWRLHSKNNVQCKLCSKEQQKNRREKNPLRFLFEDAKKHSKLKNREFSITIDDIKNTLIKQKNCCALSGVEFNKENKPSLDRIDSSKGYTVNNIQLLLIDINVMKNKFIQENFIKLCNLISENQKGKK